MINPSRPQHSRRRFLQATAAVPPSALAMSLGWPAVSPAHADPGTDYTTRETFDRLDLSYNNGNGQADETNDSDSSGLGGKIAWGEAYVLQAYALMYEAYRDTYYLDKLIDHIDQVLANRDSVRGVTDHTGASKPSWRTDNPYTNSYVTIPDAAGRPVFEVRSALSYADGCIATVTSVGPGTFDLSVRNPHHDRVTEHQGLSIDPDSPDYAVTKVLEGFHAERPARVLVTLRDLRTPDQPLADPVPGDHVMAAGHYIFEVHTGQAVLPMVQFAKYVLGNAELRANQRYRSKAEEYVAAAEDAVAVHSDEWRTNSKGEGWYVTLPDAPVWWAGTENPFNHFLALGRAELQLGIVTGDRQYLDRAFAQARTLLNAMTPTEQGGYAWPYWLPWGAEFQGWDIDAPKSEYRPWYPSNQVPEDTSHSQIDANFALECYRSLREIAPQQRPVFTATDMQRLATTFTTGIATHTADGTATVYRFIDGTGALEMAAYERQAAAWAGFTPWNGQVLSHLRDVFAVRDFATVPSMLYCVAWLNHGARVGRRGPRT